MKNILTTTSDNPNYLAKVIKVKDLRKHSNADRLQCMTIDGNNIITDLSAQEGSLYIYFPIESSINKDFISYTNSFQEKELNKDQTVKGMFNKHARVRAISLRGERSEGFMIPTKKIEDWLESTGQKVEITEEYLDTYFDTIDGVVLCQKYVNENALRQKQLQEEREKRRLGKKVKRTSKLVDGQFRLAEDTLHLKKLVEKIDPEDYITIAYKMHGTNFSCGRVLCKKPLKWYEKALKTIGVNVIDTQYDLVFASRRVIKNSYADQQTQNFYSEDIWQRASEIVKDKLKDGISIHAEIVGHLSTGAEIQRGYDYGCSPQDFDVYVYRMFYTNPSGDVFEFTTPQIQKYCQKVGLKVVPIFYYGKAKDCYPELETIEHWHRNFLDKLILDYTEKDCYMCKNKVPEEGICLVKNDEYFSAFKLKSFRFLQRETEELDKGEVNIEDVA
jgi:hypothetical protein